MNPGSCTRWMMLASACLTSLLARPGEAMAAACATANTWPVVSCQDWVTGPGSSDGNMPVTKYPDPGTGALLTSTLWSTDQGWPVMDPTGADLKVMAYGDTRVLDHNHVAYNICYQDCLIQPDDKVCREGAGEQYPNCPEYFTMNTHEEVCDYICAIQATFAAWFSWYNAIFYKASEDATKNYRIRYDQHLWHKVVVDTTLEDFFGQFTGVYTTDYFYACVGASPVCTDANKYLYFVTGTTTWDTPPSPYHTLIQAYTDGTGIYQFGLLSSMTVVSNHGCRVPFDVPLDSAGDYLAGYYPSCLPAPAATLQPVHPHMIGTVVVDKTANWNVLWGWGSRFSVATPMRGYADPYDASSSQYVYFLGSGELDYYLNPTGKIYMARVLAAEASIEAGAFEYFKGISAGHSTWGTYGQAISIADHGAAAYFPYRVGSFIKKGSYYYLNATASKDLYGNPIHGMLVFKSTSGFSWGTPKVAVYSTVVEPDPELDGVVHAATWLAYGHYWVPEGLMSHSTRIPYLFSVWKGYDGYFEDYFFNPAAADPVAFEDRFREYNTKMYWYQP